MASYDFDPASGRFHIRFRWGKAFKRPLKLENEAEARRVIAAVDDTIKDLKRGRLTIPDGADAGAFILSGGKLAAKPKVEPGVKGLTLAGLVELYDEQTNAKSKEATTRATEGYHKSHLLRLLGGKLPIETVELRHVQRYANARLGEEWRGKSIGPATILKEVATLRVIWNWGRKMGHHARPFPLQLQDLEFDRREDRAPFQTYDQIMATIARGVPEEEQGALWECLYLTLDEVHQLPEHVREHAYHPFIHPMFVFAAMTGARRSEICRARVEDFDFDRRLVTLREKKRKRGRDSFRKVDMSGQLHDVMRDYFRDHQAGQFAIAKDGEPLTVKMATDHFKRVLQKSKWAVVPGFHTLRHCFASILASKGVDEPTIDKWMGHQTPEQRERYRHLFPAGLKRSIELLDGASVTA